MPEVHTIFVDLSTGNRASTGKLLVHVYLNLAVTFKYFHYFQKLPSTKTIILNPDSIVSENSMNKSPK